jgi:hypothetical protein
MKDETNPTAAEGVSQEATSELISEEQALEAADAVEGEELIEEHLEGTEEEVLTEGNTATLPVMADPASTTEPTQQAGSSASQETEIKEPAENNG